MVHLYPIVVPSSGKKTLMLQSGLKLKKHILYQTNVLTRHQRLKQNWQLHVSIKRINIWLSIEFSGKAAGPRVSKFEQFFIALGNPMERVTLRNFRLSPFSLPLLSIPRLSSSGNQTLLDGKSMKIPYLEKMFPWKFPPISIDDVPIDGCPWISWISHASPMDFMTGTRSSPQRPKCNSSTQALGALPS